MSKPLITIAALVMSATWAVCASAATITLNTAALIGSSSAPFYLDFQLIDGDGISNNAVTLSSFQFGSGGAIGSPIAVGGSSGTVGTSVSLTDPGFFNEFIQQFTPGATLSFSFLTTSNFVSPTPDRFTFAILNGSLVEVPTAGAGNELFGLDLMLPLTFETYAGVNNGVDPILSAPQVTASSPVPEPATATLLVGGALLAVRRRFGRAARRR